MMTPRQAALFAFVARFQRTNGGVSPSFDQMKHALNLASKSGVARILDEMEEKGIVRRLRGRSWRGLELLIPVPEVDALDREQAIDRIVEEAGDRFGLLEGGLLILRSTDLRALLQVELP